MTKKETIEACCEIVGLAYHSIRDYSGASDCFCNDDVKEELYRNDGSAVDYVRRAVVRALKADGYKLPRGTDPETGKEVEVAK